MALMKLGVGLLIFAASAASAANQGQSRNGKFSVFQVVEFPVFSNEIKFFIVLNHISIFRTMFVMAIIIGSVHVTQSEFNSVHTCSFSVSSSVDN